MAETQHNGRARPARPRFRSWVSSPSIRVGGLFALVGAGFAGGSLLLARALSREEFGIVALWLALYYVCGALAPWGAEGVVNRRRIRPGRRLARRAFTTSAATATLSTAVAVTFYGFSATLSLLLWAAIVAGGLGTVAAAQFQARHRFLTAMSIWRGSNIVILAAAIAALADPRAGVLLPLAVFTAGQLVVAAAGWAGLRRVARGEPDAATEPFAWSEALSYFTAASATAFLPQIERLVLPGVLSIDDLAVFGVLAALVIAPYRMFQAGVNYTLFPRLSKAGSKRHRRLLIRSEVRTMLMGGVVAGLLIWYVAPVVAGAFLGDKYHLEASLLLAGVVAGCAKLVEALGRAIVSALGTNRDLALYGTASWVALGAACLGAWLGSRWGVPGVIYGTMLGLSIRSVSGLVLGMLHLNDPVKTQHRRASARYRAEEGAAS
jgi:hypothetical protein